MSDVGGAGEGEGVGGGGVSEGFAFAWQHQTVAKPGERGGRILYRNPLSFNTFHHSMDFFEIFVSRNFQTLKVSLKLGDARAGNFGDANLIKTNDLFHYKFIFSIH